MEPRLFKEEYLHFRQISPNGEVLPNGGVTVYYNPLSGDNSSLGFSVCSVKDIYSKKFGRLRAQGKSVSSSENHRMNFSHLLTRTLLHDIAKRKANELFKKYNPSCNIELTIVDRRKQSEPQLV